MTTFDAKNTSSPATRAGWRPGWENCNTCQTVQPIAKLPHVCGVVLRIGLDNENTTMTDDRISRPMQDALVVNAAHILIGDEVQGECQTHVAWETSRLKEGAHDSTLQANRRDIETAMLWEDADLGTPLGGRYGDPCAVSTACASTTVDCRSKPP